MFGKAKNFLMKKMLDRQLKDASPEQREMITTMLENNPELFEKIAKEIQEEMKRGSNQMTAAMKVMPKYQEELRKAMGDKLPQQMQQGGQVQFNPNGSIHK